MILAAGEGRRLRPLTAETPKALVPVGGVPMLEIVLRRLIRAGVSEAAVNSCHLAGQIEEFLRSKGDFGIRVRVFREDALLGTGGGLKNAAGFFDDGRPFFVYNADTLNDIDLTRLYEAHEKSGALATLSVSDRPYARRLVFNATGRLLRREEAGRLLGPGERALAFDSIHVAEPGIFPKLEETGDFSIIDAYLRLASEGAAIAAFDATGAYWTSIETPEELKAARERAERLGLPQ